MANTREVCVAAAMPDAAEWRRLADLAKVLTRNRKWWIDRVGWHIHGVRANRKSGFRLVHVYAGKTASQLERIAKLAGDLRGAIVDLDDAAGALFDHKLRQTHLSRTDDIENLVIDLYCRHLDILSAAAVQAAALAKEKLSHGGLQPGMEHGKRKYDPLLDNFISMITVTTLEAGGKLTVNKGRETGTLFDLLEALRPYLPTGFLPPPDIRPASTYRRIVARATDSWRDLGGPQR